MPTVVCPLFLEGGITTRAVSQPIRTTGNNTGWPGARSGNWTYIASGKESGSIHQFEFKKGLVLYGTAITTQGAGYNNAIWEGFWAVFIGVACMRACERGSTVLFTVALEIPICWMFAIIGEVWVKPLATKLSLLCNVWWRPSLGLEIISTNTLAPSNLAITAV